MSNADEIRAAVRARYAAAASAPASPADFAPLIPAGAQPQAEAPAAQPSCCDPQATSACCGPNTHDLRALAAGYSSDDLTLVPAGANLGLGCGSPTAIASLRPGETVLDLGAGAGFDCFLAARQVGETGQVIGVDMTPEMVARARQNAHQSGFANISFRLGEIEHLPVADQSVDVIISNCVINLSPDKPKVFAEAFRVLKPGGRLAISDMVAALPLPPHIAADVALQTGCIAGAATVADLTDMLTTAGFTQVKITPKDSREMLQSWGASTSLWDLIFSAIIEAVRPTA